MEPKTTLPHDDEIDPLADTERTPTWFPPEDDPEDDRTMDEPHAA